MRTSGEIHGSQHRKRGHMLMSLRRLEERGFVQRVGHHWSTGIITEAGRRYLDTNRQPVKRATRTSDLGIAPDGGTRFPTSLYLVGEAPILSLGGQNHKLGPVVTKGRHRGLPIRAVTLEEGRTCPLSCQLRSKCYGGGMPSAKRLKWHGTTTALAIADAIRDEPKPVMVRLHTLGDFPTIAYARSVISALAASGSAAFGFTHWGPETTLGYALRRWAREHWGFFSVRTSYLAGSREPIPERSAVIVSHPDEAKEHNAVVCPEQLGKVASCGQCGFCWHSTRPVAFVLHENLARLKRAAEDGLPAAPLKEAA